MYVSMVDCRDAFLSNSVRCGCGAGVVGGLCGGVVCCVGAVWVEWDGGRLMMVAGGILLGNDGPMGYYLAMMGQWDTTWQ